MSHDHQEIDLSLIAGVTDRGLRHRQNEDAMELAVVPAADGPVLVAVVCDGVSASIRPAEASLAAAQAAAEVLRTAAQDGTDLTEASSAAVRSAVDAVASLAQSPGGVGSATFVSAVITSSAATLCWLGDSRAYWLGAPVTPAPGEDHPPRRRRIGSPGRLAGRGDGRGRAAARGGGAQFPACARHVPLGRRGSRRGHPARGDVQTPGPGVLMLCSDGLWIAGRPRETRELALPGALTDPLAAAQILVTFAIKAGGRTTSPSCSPRSRPAPDTRQPGQPGTDSSGEQLGERHPGRPAGWC